MSEFSTLNEPSMIRLDNSDVSTVKIICWDPVVNHHGLSSYFQTGDTQFTGCACLCQSTKSTESSVSTHFEDGKTTARNMAANI